MSKLQDERRQISAKLFLVRCCIAWLPICVFHAIERRPIGGLSLLLYVIGIPSGLWGPRPIVEMEANKR